MTKTPRVHVRAWRVAAILALLVSALAVISLVAADDAITPTDQSEDENGPIAFVRSSGRSADILILGADDSTVRALVAGDGTRSAPAWSPDGHQLAYAERAAGGGGFHIHVLDGSGSTQLMDGPWIDGSPTWSSDGSRIAFSSNRDGQGFGIYLMQADGAELERVADGQMPRWSSDGSRIAFVKLVGSQFEIFTMAPDGSDERNVTEHPADDRDPSWSPGGRLVFSSDREGTFDLYTAEADGSDIRRVTGGANHDRDPAWSPDGSVIAFSRWTERSADLWVLQTEGGDAQRLTRGGLADVSPAWRPGAPSG